MSGYDFEGFSVLSFCKWQCHSRQRERERELGFYREISEFEKAEGTGLGPFSLFPFLWVEVIPWREREGGREKADNLRRKFGV